MISLFILSWCCPAELCLYRTNRFTAAFPNWLIVCLGHLAAHVLRLHWEAVQNRAISASSGISKFTSRWHGEFCGKSTPDPELIPDIYFRVLSFCMDSTFCGPRVKAHFACIYGILVPKLRTIGAMTFF